MMMDRKILNEIGVYAESIGFEYIHNSATCKRIWAEFVDKESRTISVFYDDVEWHDRVGINFLCGDKADAQEARMIGKYYTDALKIMEMIVAAPKTRRSD